MIKRTDTENNHAPLAQILFKSKCLFTQGHKKSSYDIRNCLYSSWTSQGLNLGPPDYESVALTN